MLVGAWLLASSTADARSIAGAQLPEQVTVAGRELVLNGAAVQKLFIFKVYSVALYLENPTNDALQAMRSNEVKRIHLRVLHSASSKQIVGALRNGMKKAGGDMHALEGRLQQVTRQIPDVRAGQVLLITYLPGQGTELRTGGTRMVVPGKDFAEALFGTWLGPDPGVRRVREGLLGGH